MSNSHAHANWPRWLYTLLFMALSPLLAISLWRKKRALGKSPDNEWQQRLGFGFPTVNPGSWLLHCASMGEVSAAAPLIRVLLERGVRLTLTTSTAAGAAQVARLFPEQLTHIYLPFDLPGNMSRLLRHVKPQRLLIIEVELWPNLLAQCKKRQIPVYLLNARLTNDSCRRYSKWPKLVQPMLSALSHVAAQDQRDADNYRTLGVSAEKISINGNIKFALSQSNTLLAQREQLATRLNTDDRPTLLAASTHAGEESELIQALKVLATQYPALLLVLVPRHPQRFSEVEALCRQSGLNWQAFSSGQPVDNATQILLVDALGQLQALYGLCNMAFVGGSITDRGGHNPLEAALFGKPVMMGPHRENNLQICEIMAAQGALAGVTNAGDIVECTRYWLDDSTAYQLACASSQRCLQSGQDALSRTLDMLGL